MKLCTNCEGQKDVRPTEKEEKGQGFRQHLPHARHQARHVRYTRAWNPHWPSSTKKKTEPQER